MPHKLQRNISEGSATTTLQYIPVTLDEDTISDAIKAALKEIKTAIDGNWDGSQTDKSTEA